MRDFKCADAMLASLDEEGETRSAIYTDRRLATGTETEPSFDAGAVQDAAGGELHTAIRSVESGSTSVQAALRVSPDFSWNERLSMVRCARSQSAALIAYAACIGSVRYIGDDPACSTVSAELVDPVSGCLGGIGGQTGRVRQSLNRFAKLVARLKLGSIACMPRSSSVLQFMA